MNDTRDKGWLVDMLRINEDEYRDDRLQSPNIACWLQNLVHKPIRDRASGFYGALDTILPIRLHLNSAQLYGLCAILVLYFVSNRADKRR